MEIAIRDVTLYQAGFDHLTEGSAQVGLRRLEVALSRTLGLPAPQESLRQRLPAGGEEERRAAREAYREAGLELCALFVPNNFNAPDREAEVAWVVEAVGVADALGVPVVRLDGAMSGPERLNRRRRVALYAEALEQVLERTPQAQAALAVENHGRQGNDLIWLEDLLRQADSPRVGLTLDPANLYWAGYPLEQVYEIAARLAPRVLHLHAKNLGYPEALRQRRRPLGWAYDSCVCPLAAGDLDYCRLLGLLRAVGYPGVVAIEEEALGSFSPTQRAELLRQDVAYLQSCLEAPAD